MVAHQKMTTDIIVLRATRSKSIEVEVVGSRLICNGPNALNFFVDLTKENFCLDSKPKSRIITVFVVNWH